MDLQGKNMIDLLYEYLQALSVTSSYLPVLRTRGLNVLTVMLKYLMKTPNLTGPTLCSLGLMLNVEVQFTILSQDAL